MWRRLEPHFQAGLLAAWLLSGLQKAIMVTGHSIACVLLAGYVFAPVIRHWVCGSGCVMRESALTRESGRMGRLFVFFTLGGETGLINENEGDI